ncbi:uncharacterized protein LOC109835120 [Asparagus officinalis]|uniref:uncharacterized protein LOC109835120 n=1 Tax=Asparagus officinalis TaxID=4686 RepID=UPI00098DFC34|nr:uncharacterized protein LOC109835120 [Asparagus officinalis]
MASAMFHSFRFIFLCFVLCHNGVNGTPRKGLTLNEAFLKKDSGEEVGVQEVNPNELFLYQSREGRWGTQAEFVVYGLQNVELGQDTSAYISVISGLDGSRQDINHILAGWHVSPGLYGDTDTHFFTYWTADGNMTTGCFNLLCKGFVPSNTSEVPGFKIWPLSVYNGTQYVIRVKLHKDETSGNWLLHVQDKLLGYWPKTLFKSLSVGAQEINWGGNVNFENSQRSPPLGSGHFPEEGGGKAAAIQEIQFVNQHGEPYDLNPDLVSSYVDNIPCIKLGELFHTNIGFMFYFGGPGGC